MKVLLHGAEPDQAMMRRMPSSMPIEGFQPIWAMILSLEKFSRLETVARILPSIFLCSGFRLDPISFRMMATRSLRDVETPVATL